MPSSTLSIVLCLFAGFGAEEICGEASNDNWQTIFSEASLWNENWLQTRVVYDIEQDPFGIARRASTYQRNPRSSQTKNRVLFVDFDGFTWIFSPRTASWTRLSTSGIGDDEVKHFSKLVANSITSLCGTRVIAFAGVRSDYNDAEASYETWLFSGASEKWTALTITTEVPRARFGHEAISHCRTESSCQCKESVIVFGGKDVYKKLLHDIWELQCVDDRNEASAKYRWVELKTNLGPLKEYKLNRLTPFSVNNTHIFWLIDDNQRAWIFDLKTERWSSILINIVFSNNETISMLGSARAAGNFDTIGNVYVRQHRLFIFLISTSLMGVYNVEQNRFQFINVEIYCNVQTTTFVAKMMTLRKHCSFHRLNRKLTMG